jgi:hypothetical protein
MTMDEALLICWAFGSRLGSSGDSASAAASAAGCSQPGQPRPGARNEVSLTESCLPYNSITRREGRASRRRESLDDQDITAGQLIFDFNLPSLLVMESSDGGRDSVKEDRIAADGIGCPGGRLV